MKKVSVIAIIVLVVVIPLLLFVFSRKGNISIPLVEGLSWKSTPNQTAQLLGEPVEEWLDTQVTGKNIYIYGTNIFGREASVRVFFLNNKIPTDLYFTWEHCDEDFFDQVYECMYSYCKEKNFFVDKTSYSQHDKYISINKTNGTTMISYTIIQDGTTVRVNCVKRS